MSGLTSTWSAIFLFRCRVAREDLTLSSNKSAIAVNLTFESATSVFLAAPVPRPPQPTRPTLRALFCPAKRLGARARPPAMAEVVRKSRRVVVGFISEGLQRRDDQGSSRIRQQAGLSLFYP